MPDDATDRKQPPKPADAAEAAPAEAAPSPAATSPVLLVPPAPPAAPDAADGVPEDAPVAAAAPVASVAPRGPDVPPEAVASAEEAARFDAAIAAAPAADAWDPAPMTIAPALPQALSPDGDAAAVDLVPETASGEVPTEDPLPAMPPADPSEAAATLAEGDGPAVPAEDASQVVARHPVLYTNERDVWVTTAHAVLPDRTLLLADVQWVDHQQKGRSRTAKWTVALGVLMLGVAMAGPLPLATSEQGVAAVADASSPAPWGILFLGFGLLVLLATRPRHEVLFLLHDGRTHLHVTRDEAEATQISQAVNRRIVEDGGSPNRFFRVPARP